MNSACCTTDVLQDKDTAQPYGCNATMWACYQPWTKIPTVHISYPYSILLFDVLVLLHCMPARLDAWFCHSHDIYYSYSLL